MCLINFINLGTRSGEGIGDVMISPKWSDSDSGFRILDDFTFYIFNCNCYFIEYHFYYLILLENFEKRIQQVEMIWKIVTVRVLAIVIL